MRRGRIQGRRWGVCRAPGRVLGTAATVWYHGPVRLDLHVHLSPYSNSSDFTLEEYVRLIDEQRIPVATVTDYGTVAACDALERQVGGVIVVYGVELQTHEGSFLVYSSDRKFLAKIPPRIRTLTELPRDGRTAVVWAHPRMPWSNGWRAPFPNQPLTKFIFEHVDAVEFYNGAMLAMGRRGSVEPNYHAELRAQVERWKVAAVGGSACQTADGFLSAWTTFPRIRNTQDFVTAIKDRAVRPGAQLGKGLLTVV